MFALLILLSSAASDDVARFKLSPPPITITCVSGHCGSGQRKDSYRVPAEADRLAKTSKDRAFAADGTDCTVIGDKYCTSSGHKIFSTDFSQ